MEPFLHLQVPGFNLHRASHDRKALSGNGWFFGLHVKDCLVLWSSVWSTQNRASAHDWNPCWKSQM